jgi:glycosyltransferase involved in cell wall biosynthesis
MTAGTKSGAPMTGAVPDKRPEWNVDLSKVGVVAIGRNEGERLERALKAVARLIPRVVYVDSGSTDGSNLMASGLGVTVAELDRTQPFTHAKARNLGFETIMRMQPDLELVHFIDGDCEIVEGWIERAVTFLRERPDIAWVCGRVLELFPERSLYNHLRWMEWNWDPFGEVAGSAGNGLTRVSAVKQVGGFDGSLIGGADLEICLRMRQKCGKIWRLDADMCRHDSAMYTYGQWWRRNLRAGHVYAEGAWMHGRGPARYHVRPTISNFFWAYALPAAAIAPAWATAGASLLLFALYPVKTVQIAWRMRRQGYGWKDALLYAFFCITDKLPMAIGQTIFLLRTLSRRGHVLMEYK